MIAMITLSVKTPLEVTPVPVKPVTEAVALEMTAQVRRVVFSFSLAFIATKIIIMFKNNSISIT